MGGTGLIFTPVLGRHLLGPLGLSRDMINTLGLIDVPNNPIEKYNPPPTAHPPPIHPIRDITVVVKKTQNPPVLVSYYR